MTTKWMEEVQQENANIEKFLRGMSEYPSPIPDTVIMHVLAEAGLQTSDPRVHRTLNVAIQKFITEVLADCATAAKQRNKASQQSSSSKKSLDLQVSDLKCVLERRDIHVYRPEFIVSIPQNGHEE
ncbi:Transcription initiation factor TFIID subunit 10 [Tritrichomonas musculus]|uniref:Transcription initiation factor TFIID subunit 10 n=1 Tax=Tritrichomonas musculus TaxID=1915356 RepID=A0ABR2KIM7_9EUKA